jgi:hypothetical protein
MDGRRLLYGLKRLPRTLATNDARLPAVVLGDAPLRLNSVPLEASAWGAGQTDHATRMAAMRAWLLARCGDYEGTLRRCVTRYLDGVEDHVAHNRGSLTAGLALFEGLYSPDDWCWSALRPLPHAWWRQGDVWVKADLAFWDGRSVVTMQPAAFEAGVLPVAFQQFWDGQILPVSPFRRDFPVGSDAWFRPSP